MFSNTTIQKCVQTSQEVQPPIHVPIVVGNECFVITQQDVRNIEDMRLFTYNRLSPRGEIIPMASLYHDDNARDSILNACTYRRQIEQTSAQPYNGILAELAEYLAKQCNNKSNNVETCMQQEPTIASLQQQMQWEKSPNNSSAPYPLTYTTGDSVKNTIQCTKKPCSCCNTKCITSTCTRGSNTMDFEESTNTKTTLSAREQLKQKKITQECMNLM